MLILEVTVDGLGNADHLNTCIMSLIVLGKLSSIGVSVIAANNHQSNDFELAQDLQTCLELLGLLKLGAARTNHVKTASIAVLLNEVAG